MIEEEKRANIGSRNIGLQQKMTKVCVVASSKKLHSGTGEMLSLDLVCDGVHFYGRLGWVMADIQIQMDEC